MNRYEALEIIKRFDHADALDYIPAGEGGNAIRVRRLALVEQAQELLLSDCDCTDQDAFSDSDPEADIPIPNWIQKLMDEIDEELLNDKTETDDYSVPKIGFCEKCAEIPVILVRRFVI